MEFYYQKPGVGEKPAYSLSNREEKAFIDIILPEFHKKFNDYFDEYGSCQLYSNHLKYLYDMMPFQSPGTEALNSFKAFLANCLDNNVELYFIGD